MSAKDCKPTPDSALCCIAEPTTWEVFLTKLGVLQDGVYIPRKDRRRFTYAISAPQNPMDIELRIAKMQGKTFGTVFHDLWSKHAWLANLKDWVIYAGELWIQAKPGISPS